MIALCTKCQTVQEFNQIIDYCYKCGATNIVDGFVPCKNRSIDSHLNREGIRDSKKQKQYVRPIGTCSKCGRKKQKLYKKNPPLCQNCYRWWLGQKHGG